MKYNLNSNLEIVKNLKNKNLEKLLHECIIQPEIDITNPRYTTMTWHYKSQDLEVEIDSNNNISYNWYDYPYCHTQDTDYEEIIDVIEDFLGL